SEGASVDTTFDLTVLAVNDAPVAVNDSATTAEDTPVTIDVAANDTDVDDASLTVSLETGDTAPAGGSVAVVGNSVVYTPDADFSGSDTFTYTVTDAGGETSTATVNVTVTPVNDAPVAVDGTASTDEDVAITAGDLTADVTDVDSTGLTYVALTQPTDGTLVLDGDGSFTYTPDANFSGSDSFTYRVLDNAGGADEATVIITVNSVNDLPTADDQSVSTDENTPVAIVLTGSDVETDPLTIFAVVDQPTSGTLSGTAPNLTYTPNANFFGSDSFTFTVEDADGGVSSTATVSISVGSVNSTPTLDNAIVAADATEGTAYSLVVPTNTFSDVEDATLTLTASGLPSWLSFDGSEFSGTPLNGDDGTTTITVTATDSEGASVDTTFDLTVLAVNDAPVAVNDSATTAEDTPVTIDVAANDTDVDDASLTVSLETGDTAPADGSVSVVGNSVVYTPDADFSGSDTFTYTVTDAGGETSTATVNVTVTPVNDAPVAVDGTASTDEDVAITAGDLTADVTDVDSTGLTYVTLTQPTNGTLVLDGDGSFTYTPDANFSGPDSFTYRVLDNAGGADEATVNITVNSVNDLPTADDQSVTVDENDSVAIVLTGSDVETDPLTIFAVVDQPTSGTLSGTAPNLTYTPNANFFGSDSFT
ncbi:Ig-like domain-containing protein, partial [Rubripirellula obstinata]